MDAYWIAKFNDDSIIEQFDGKNENKFSLVEDRMDDLVSFKVICDKDEYEVDITESFIYENSHKYTVKGKNPKLVYFRRNTIRLNPKDGKILDSKKVSHLGIKTDSDETTVLISPGLGRKEQKAIIKEKGKVDKTLTIKSKKEIKE